VSYDVSTLESFASDNKAADQRHGDSWLSSLRCAVDAFTIARDGLMHDRSGS